MKRGAAPALVGLRAIDSRLIGLPPWQRQLDLVTSRMALGIRLLQRQQLAVASGGRISFDRPVHEGRRRHDQQVAARRMVVTVATIEIELEHQIRNSLQRRFERSVRCRTTRRKVRTQISSRTLSSDPVRSE